MSTIYGDQFDFSVGGVDFCGSQANVQMRRDVQRINTNCGVKIVGGNKTYDTDISGPLDFGAGLTEAGAWAAINDADGGAWEFDPRGTGTAAADNPILTGNIMASQFNISASATAPINYQFNALGMESLPTRTIT